MYDWNEFRRCHAGQGKKPDELSDLFKKYKAGEYEPPTKEDAEKTPVVTKPDPPAEIEEETNECLTEEIQVQEDSESRNEIEVLVDWLKESEKTTKDFFAEMDLNDDNYVDPFEFGEALRKLKIADLAPWDVDRLLGAIDINKDGKIDLPELDILILKLMKDDFDINEEIEKVVAEDASYKAVVTGTGAPTISAGFTDWLNGIWTTPKSKLASAFPTWGFLKKPEWNRAIFIGSGFVLLILLFNAFFGIASGPGGELQTIDWGKFMLRRLFGQDGLYDSSPHAGLDVLGFAFMVLFSIIFYHTQPSDEE